MTNAFDSLLASQIFVNFCDMITGSEYESLIRDLYLQQGLSERSASMREGEMVIFTHLKDYLIQ